MVGPIVGIDLGTSSCSVARLIDGQPQVLPVFLGHDEMPTYVAFAPDGERLVGWPAKRQAITNPANTIFTIKRLIGRRFASEATQAELGLLPYHVLPSASGGLWVQAGGRSYSPTEITAMMLAEVRRATEAYLGCSVNTAVITVPAYFDEAQRRATKDAAKIAGIEPLRLIAEPTAAALAYGFGRDSTTKNIAVYDLGGGTFEISILQIGDGVFEAIAVNGDNRLGGEDFDHRLVRYFVDELARYAGLDLSADPLALHRLKDAAEQIKIRLDALQSAEISLPYLAVCDGKPFHATIELSRSRLEELFAPLIDRTLGPCRQALEDAFVNPSVARDGLDAVVLVGGMSRMPGLRKRVADFFSLESKQHHDPGRIVAQGAAISAAVLEGLVRDVLLLDIVPMSLGFLDHRGKTILMIDKNTTVPTKKSLSFKQNPNDDDLPVSDFLKLKDLDIVQVQDDERSKYLSIAKLPVPPAEEGDLKLTFDIDANSLMHVTIQNLQSGAEYCHRVEVTNLYGIDPAGDRSGESHGVQEDISVARVRADELLTIVDTLLREHGQLLRPEIVHQIVEAREGLRRAMQSRDAAELVGALAALCEISNLRLPATKTLPKSGGPPVAIEATTSGRSIFISYAREDLAWLHQLRTHLSPLERHGKVEIWHDGKIQTGALWQAEIDRAVAKASVAILLVSAHFMASRFVYDHELPPILERNRAYGLKVFPVFVGHCYFHRDPVLSRLNAFNDPQRPFSSMPVDEADAQFARLISELWNQLDPTH